MVLDAGTAVFRLIQCLRAQPQKQLDILLTHAHLDHIVGLTFLIDAIAVTQLEHVRIHGEADKLQAVKEHLYHHLLFPVPPEFEFVPLESAAGSRNIGSAKVSWFQLEHPGGSVGYIIEAHSKKLSYVTDTVSRVAADYIPLIAKSDLLLHECYFEDKLQALAIKTGHSWLAAVTEIVRAAAARQTLLIHINPLAEILGDEIELSAEHRNELNMQVAEDMMVVEF